MIKATMYWNRMRLDVDGHAGAAEKGEDLICAAVSMMTQTLGRVLEETEARGRIECKVVNREGKAMIWANPTIGCMNETKAYFRFVVLGLRLLARQYPANVAVKEVN